MSEINYSRQTPGLLLDKLALKKRLLMLEMFFSEFPFDSNSLVLDVGATADKKALSSNYLEKHYPLKSQLIALSNQDASFLEKDYPGLKFQYGDACHLPFSDKSIDIVFSSAVIEHIGSSTKQKEMIMECCRVAKQGVFITTPNRWFPIEMHTLLPFIHWLPKYLHRSLLKLLKLPFYSHESNLNLLDHTSLRRICEEIGVMNYRIKNIKTYGLNSNLILIIKNDH